MAERSSARVGHRRSPLLILAALSLACGWPGAANPGCLCVRCEFRVIFRRWAVRCGLCTLATCAGIGPAIGMRCCGAARGCHRQPAVSERRRRTARLAGVDVRHRELHPARLAGGKAAFPGGSELPEAAFGRRGRVPPGAGRAGAAARAGGARSAFPFARLAALGSGACTCCPAITGTIATR